MALTNGILQIQTMFMVSILANSDSTVTFQDVIDFNGDPVVSTFCVGDTIFIKSGFENGTINEAIHITYDMYPAEDDGISLGAFLGS